MRVRQLIALAVTALCASVACYQDDGTGTLQGKPVARVLLTDAPFPFDSVAHVNVYVVRVDATTNPDTTRQDSGWVTVAAPHKVFDLLALQQGTTTLVGSGELSAGEYRAVRVVINADSSAILWSGGIPAPVDWQSFGNPEVALYALVESPVAVPEAGADIVIDFDVGRSFLYDYFGSEGFVLSPWLRAVNAAATGAIAGTVTSDLYGSPQPLRNVNVSVYQGDPTQSLTAWRLMATGHTDAQGHYRIAYLRPASYIVRFEEPIIPALTPVTEPSVSVLLGDTTRVDAFLAESSYSSAGLHLSGPGSVGVGGAATFSAWVSDSTGAAVSNPSVTWALSDTGLATITGDSSYASGAAAFVAGKVAGWVTLTATSGSLSASLLVQVVAPPAPVASVTLTPSDTTVSTADSLPYHAVLRDSTGAVIQGDVAVSWSISDSTVARLVWTGGVYALVQPVAPGTAVLQAMAQDRVGQATIHVQ